MKYSTILHILSLSYTFPIAYITIPGYPWPRHIISHLNQCLISSARHHYLIHCNTIPSCHKSHLLSRGHRSGELAYTIPIFLLAYSASPCLYTPSGDLNEWPWIRLLSWMGHLAHNSMYRPFIHDYEPYHYPSTSNSNMSVSKYHTTALDWKKTWSVCVGGGCVCLLCVSVCLFVYSSQYNLAVWRCWNQNEHVLIIWLIFCWIKVSHDKD